MAKTDNRNKVKSAGEVPPDFDYKNNFTVRWAFKDILRLSKFSIELNAHSSQLADLIDLYFRPNAIFRKAKLIGAGTEGEAWEIAEDWILKFHTSSKLKLLRRLDCLSPA